MITRTIMIFPEFDNIEVIKGIRTKYDPLADYNNTDIFLTKIGTADKITLIIGKEELMTLVICNQLRRRCRRNLL